MAQGGLDRALNRYLARRLLAPVSRLRQARIAARAAPGRPYGAMLANGRTLFVLPDEFVGKRVLRHGAFEFEVVWIIDRLARALGRRGTLLDIGANIGSHTLIYADLFDAVHAFEPMPVTRGLLARSVAENGLAHVHVHVHGFGLSNVTAELPYAAESFAPGNLSFGSFYDGNAAALAEGVTYNTTLPVRRGDDAIRDLGIARVDAIKIDVDGHEPEALEGLAETLVRDRPLVAFELKPELIDHKDGRARLATALDGYDFFVPTRASRWQGYFVILASYLFGPRFRLEKLSPLSGSYMAVYGLPREALPLPGQSGDLIKLY